MSKVKRKAPAKKSSKTKPKRGAKTSTPLGQRLSEQFSGVAIAAGAGLCVAALIGVAVLWTGGYFGVLGEKTKTAMSHVVVAAGFDVKRITVKGLTKTSEDELLNVIGPIVGDSILHFDHHRARGRVEELGWVRAAAVSRLLPDTVHISVREREPAAVWQLAGRLYLIDDIGAVIDEVGAYEYSNLPLIVGAGAPEAASGMLNALQRRPKLWRMAAALVRVSDRRWNVRLKNGVDIKFPEVGYEAAVDDVAALQAAHGVLDENLEYVDLRDPERVVFRRRGETEEEIRPAPAR